MTSRVQHLRLTTTNTIPSTSARPTGELWVNYPDRRLGFIDSAKAPQDLLPIRRHAATATYAANDVVIQGGGIYRARAVTPPRAFTSTDWTWSFTQAVGFGMTPALDVPNGNLVASGGYAGTAFAVNAYFPGGGWKTLNTGVSSVLAATASNTIDLFVAPSVAAGATPVLYSALQFNPATQTIAAPGAINAGALSAGGGLITGGHLTVSSLSVNAADDGKVRITNTLTVDHLAVAGNAQINFNLTVLGDAYKTGGGVWLAASDSRVKTVHGLYTRGLKDILRLSPVRYTFKKNCVIGGYAMHQFETSERAGLVAQQVETSWPELVSQTEGLIDDVYVKDLRMLDTTELQFATLNALRELDARLRVIEGRPIEDGSTTTAANTPANPPDEGGPA